MGKSERHVGTRDSRRRASALVGSALVGLVLALAFPLVASAAVFTPKLAVVSAPREAGRVIVKYRSTETLEAARADAADAGARVVGRIRTFGLETTGRSVVVSSDTVSTSDLMRKYGADPAVKYVEPDYVVRVDGAITPDDPLFGSLWGLSQVSAPLAWGTSTGQADVVVADIDTGVDYTHPDLAANMWHNPGEVVGNGIDDDGNGYVDDVYGIDAASGGSDPMDAHGHGTHTSGTIAAVGDNGIGVTGVNWTARIMALKFMDSSGSGYTSDAVTCLNYMTWEKVHGGVNVVAANNSWGSGDSSQTLRDAIATAGDAGIVVVCAAGNGGDDHLGDDNDSAPHYPSSFDCANIISVAATDSADSLASFSNWGAASVDLAAPGVNILSAVPAFVDASGYQSWNGTSMATPHVTGAVALMAAAYPTESMATRISMIESGVDRMPGLVGKVVVGGRLNVANALYRGTPLTITGFSPASGSEGTSVTVTGTGFTGATAVRFNGSDAAAFTVDSSTQITATVPAGATTGPITITIPGYTRTSLASFICSMPPPPPPATDWHWQNPLPRAMRLNFVTFGDSTHGWAVGNWGEIITTADSGARWVSQTSGTTSALRSAAFTDATRGWTVGDAGTVLSTADGGSTWTRRSSGITAGATLNSVTFIDDTHGWAAGWSGFDGLIYGTTDGGMSWTLQFTGTTVRSVDFIDASHGWAVGWNGLVLATTDGGAHWSSQTSGTTDNLASVDFLDADHGWAVGTYGAILATADGGAHWSHQTSGRSDYLYSVHFTDSSHGWVAASNSLLNVDGTNGEILVTSDGGAHWTVQQSGVVCGGFSSVAFAAAGHGLAVSNSGAILATTDGGASWNDHTAISGDTSDLAGVFFADAYHGWAVGSAGALLATTDSGMHWTRQTASTSYSPYLKSVFFTDAAHGWAVGASSTILATTDGGLHWTTQSGFGTVYLLGVTFSDVGHGWAVGYDQNTGADVILATSDGGASWAPQSVPATARDGLMSVDFVDADNGWAVGNWGVILATIDGGRHWVSQPSGFDADLDSVDFIDATHGWAVGFAGKILATTDGGANWTPQGSGTTDTLRSVCFTDATHGWAVGQYEDGVVLATDDGGAHWRAESVGARLWAVHFADADHGWAVGDGGSILAFSDATADVTTPGTTSDVVGLYAGPAAITLIPRDNAGGSGVASTHWVLTGAENRSGSGATLSATTMGEYRLEFWSIDVAGNVETPHKTAAFTVAAPILFTPTSGRPGASVTVTGSGFIGTTAVKFNGTAARFTVNSATQITATVPGGATSGPISVTTPAGTAASAASFSVIPGPWIGFLMPSFGPAGTVVTLLGDNFTGATEVRFNGTPAGFTVDNVVQITATVPVGATSGPVSVTGPEGTGTSLTSFTVGTAPVDDATAPSVSATGAAQGAWYRTLCVVTLTASDSGSGVASITYALDGIETSVPGSSVVVSVLGLPNAHHTLTYHATDAAANSCADKTLKFTIDTKGPVTAGKTASGRKGKNVTLKYVLRDDLSPKASAVKLIVKDSRGAKVTSFSLGTQNIGTWHSVRWKPRTKGLYRYYVYGRDLAGNAQSRIGSASIKVR